MKYIRVQDEIYDLSNKYSQISKEAQNALMNGNYKASDTIEELCDEFVVDNPKADSKKPFTICMPFNEWLKEVKTHTPKGALDYKMTHDKMNIYGAIWCKWGLKYVAMLNSKTKKLDLISLCKDCLNE